MTSTGTPQVGGVPPAGRYLVDTASSTVSFTTRHLFGLAGVRGTFTLREGEIVVGDPAETTTLRAVVDAASFTTGTVKRDTDVVSAKYLDAANFPDITVTGIGASMRDGHWVAIGTVVAHGVSAPLELVLDKITETRDGRLSFTATSKIDRYAHGVTAGKGMAGRWMNITVDAVATPAR